MKDLKPHELSLIPPDLTPEEDQALGESLLKNGQIQDIVLYEGRILDGKHKYKHLIRLGIEPRFKEFIPNGVATAQDFVMAQLEGRHLTKGQRTCVGFLLYNRLKKDPKDSKGRDFSISRKGESSQELYKRRRESSTLGKVSKIMKVGTNVMAKVGVLLKHDKELFDMVYHGKASVEAAYAMHRRNTGARIKHKPVTTVNLSAFKTEIKIPSCTCYESELYIFIKTMNAHGWTLEMRFQGGKIYANWYGNGYPTLGNNWAHIQPEFEFKRAVVVAANDRKDKL